MIDTIPDKRKKNLHFPLLVVYLLGILACCLVAFWPLPFGTFCLKNDATLYFLPIRFQVSEMIRNGHFPFWTPYLNLGYPLYSDMQAGVWNPFVLFISLFGSYTMRSLQFELLIYVYISGITMFFLLKYFKINLRVAFLVAVSYMLSGFNLDSSQFAYWICGTAFLPVAFLYFHKMLHQLKWKDAVLFSVSFYLLFVCGYPGEFILISYLFLGYLVVFLIQEKQATANLFKILKLSAAALLLFTLLSLPAIISYISSLPYVLRGGKISYDLAMTNSMYPLNLISYFFPLTVWKLQPQITDLLGRNNYFGLFPFLLLLNSFYYRKNYLTGFLKGTFIIALLFCLGDYGLVRGAFYNILPLMNTFRHPSMARFICIFSGCILAALYLSEMPVTKEQKNKKLFSFILIVGLIIITPFIFHLFGFTTSINALKNVTAINGFKEWLDQSTLMDWFFIELLIQAPFLVIIYYYYIKKVDIKIMLISNTINILIHAALLQPVTVVKNETVSSFQSKLNSYTTSGFDAPSLNSSVFANSLSDSLFQRRYGPVTLFTKKIGEAFIFVSPSPLKSHEKLFSAENDDVRKTLFSYPILYKADTIIASAGNFSSIAEKIKPVLVDNPEDYKNYSRPGGPGNYTTRFISYTPDSWKFEINAETAGFFCLMQHYYPNWKLYINGTREKLIPCNISLIGFKINKGRNIIELTFSDIRVTVSLYISIVTFLSIAFFLVLTAKQNRPGRLL